MELGANQPNPGHKQQDLPWCAWINVDGHITITSNRIQLTFIDLAWYSRQCTSHDLKWNILFSMLSGSYNHKITFRIRSWTTQWGGIWGQHPSDGTTLLGMIFTLPRFFPLCDMLQSLLQSRGSLLKSQALIMVFKATWVKQCISKTTL